MSQNNPIKPEMVPRCRKKSLYFSKSLFFKVIYLNIYCLSQLAAGLPVFAATYFMRGNGVNAYYRSAWVRFECDEHNKRTLLLTFAKHFN